MSSNPISSKCTKHSVNYSLRFLSTSKNTERPNIAAAAAKRLILNADDKLRIKKKTHLAAEKGVVPVALLGV